MAVSNRGRARRVGAPSRRKRPDGSARLLRGADVLTGPRGTGKTTYLGEALSDALVVNLLDPSTYRRLTARPEHLREMVEGHRASSDVVVDEVQRIPELLNVVHDLMESGPTRRYVLTGSSARKLRRGGVDQLAGRAVVLARLDAQRERCRP